MKLTLACLVLVAFCAAQAEEQKSEVSQEGLVKNYNNFIYKGYSDIRKDVARHILGRSGCFVGNIFKIKPTPELVQSFPEQPTSKEGILSTLGSLIFKTAKDLLAANPSKESLTEEYLQFPFQELNATEAKITSFRIVPAAGHEGIIDFPSHEGIFGKLGSLVAKGVGNMIGGTAGKVISTAGDVIGSIFLVQPKRYEQINTDEASQEGIFRDLGNMFLKGANKLTGGLSDNLLEVAKGFVGNLFQSRGAFNVYANLDIPAKNVIAKFRKLIEYHKVPSCVAGAKLNLTTLYQEYKKNVQTCIKDGEQQVHPLIAKTRHIVSNTLAHVERVNGIISNCFTFPGKYNCLHLHARPLIPILRSNVTVASNKMYYIAHHLDRHNNEFDECVIRNLGVLRSQGHNIVSDFDQCVHAYHAEPQTFASRYLKKELISF